MKPVSIICEFKKNNDHKSVRCEIFSCQKSFTVLFNWKAYKLH